MRKLLFFLFLVVLVKTQSFAQTPATELTAKDTRNDPTTPSSYNKNLQFHLKYNSSIGLPYLGNGYSAVIGIRPWVDDWGGKAHELVFSDDDEVRIRSGYATMSTTPGWGAWRRLLSADGNGLVALRENNNYIILGKNSYPHGWATLGYGSGNNALLYHSQNNDGPTMKVDLSGNNASPAIHVSGVGGYLNGGLFNIDYTHQNYAYSVAAYKTTMKGTNAGAGASVIGFQADVSTVGGEVYGGLLKATTSGVGSAFALYLDSYLSAGGTGKTWGLYVNRGKSLFKGNVGIGAVTDPSAPLEVNGLSVLSNSAGNNYNENLRLPAASSDYASIALGAVAGTSGTGVGQWNFVRFPSASYNYMFGIQYNSTNVFSIKTDGHVGIGTTDPGSYHLAVEGNVGARKVVVTKASWADYVFEPTYKLPTLSEVEAFIQQNKHLPDVPSAKQIEKEGLDVGDSQATLLRKIEELTLYVIDLQKQVTSQQTTIGELKEQLGKK